MPHLYVSIPEGPKQHLDVPRQQEPVLLLDVSTQQIPVPHLYVSIPQGPKQHLDVTRQLEPVLLLDVSTPQGLSLDVSTPQGLSYTPGRVYTREACSSPGLSTPQGPESLL